MKETLNAFLNGKNTPVQYGRKGEDYGDQLETT